MTIDFSQIQRADVLPEFPLRVDAEEVRAYLEATGEAAASSAELWSETVPPLALGAFLFSALMELMPLPAGTLHTGQELKFHRPVSVGEDLTARITVRQRAERRGSRLTTLVLEAYAAGELVVSGRSTLIEQAGVVNG